MDVVACAMHGSSALATRPLPVLRSACLPRLHPLRARISSPATDRPWQSAHPKGPHSAPILPLRKAGRPVRLMDDMAEPKRSVILWMCSLAHSVQDGFSAAVYVLLPVLEHLWQRAQRQQHIRVQQALRGLALLSQAN